MEGIKTNHPIPVGTKKKRGAKMNKFYQLAPFKAESKNINDEAI